MNIFFLSLIPAEIANRSCDQHVIKIQLEICQMLYMAWHFAQQQDYVEKWAPFTKDGVRRGYRPAHPKHPMTMWVASSLSNYLYACEIGLALTREYTLRFGKVHTCASHLEWLYQNRPSHFEMRRSDTAHYSSGDVLPDGVTPPPQCMPVEYRTESVVDAYQMYYMMEKMRFARYKNSFT